MVAFVVYLNKRRICLAGVGADGALASIVSYVSCQRHRELRLETGGLASRTAEHLRWSKARPKVGNDIRIKIKRTRMVQEPRHRHQDDPIKSLESKKNHVRQMAKELGWTISEGGN